MELIRYLNDHFFTLEELAARCAVDTTMLRKWQARRMLPGRSYRLRLDAVCDSFFGSHREEVDAEFYAKGTADWVDVLRTLHDEAGAHAVFARRYRARLRELADAGYAPPAGLAADAHIAAEWQHFLAGTYGLCTASGLPEDIAAKEAALAWIRDAEAAGPPSDAATLARLRRCVDLLDGASSPFAPHEVARSSRRRYVDEMRRAHAL
jgi:hypothetical protein